ncbi:hypothetical protein ABPG75_008213 [Micractinium tetrahymenae]
MAASLVSLVARTPAFPLSRVARRASSVPGPAARPRAVPQPRRSAASVRAMSSGTTDYVGMVNEKVAQNPVIVFSKTYCPYCSEVKSLFERLGVGAKVVELDELADGSSVQDAVGQVTGRRTVPQVFIGGQHVGGCDDTLAAMSSGKLKSLLEAAGVTAKL